MLQNLLFRLYRFNLRRRDLTFCKLILNEYGAKLKKVRPTHTTIQQDELPPIFITTITFDGKTYVGFAGRNKKAAERNKKAAEQNAACIVIDSILINSNTVVAMTQIIKKKDKLYEAVKNICQCWECNLDNHYPPSRKFATSPTSWVPYTSQLVDNFQSNQMNYHIPSSGLPMAVVDSQAIIPKKKKKKSKKRNA
ncbi:hypothetical protein IEQ34_017575 [Dendrobium chrysotoxum]|uniref:DRBM domain-containing protein n=1 Tax=Dendrobium chrysotoxum TaxID=161865 RepID=A0AAV7GA03_DENCH|nr:hypothetical protein IEQ34_017575 [Dendrobium chrysotoxum]